MQTYQYKARDKFGKLIAGQMAGESEDAVADKLKQISYVPVFIIEAEKIREFSRYFYRFQKVSFRHLNAFTRQFATLQKAGLTIISSLEALGEQASNKILKDTIGQVGKDIKGGSNLSSALGKHPKIFNSIYVNMIEAGEASGTLDQVLERLATLGEHEEVIQLRIKAATRYPVIVVVAIIIGFIVLTAFVVPRFAEIYSQFTTALPLPTRMLIWINYAITRFWWLVFVAIGILIFSFNKFINTKQGRPLWDNLKLKIPVFGPLVLKLTMSRFARITGTLMHSGVPLLRILELAAGGVGNVIISRTIGNIRTNVIEGKGMAEPMKFSGMFPPVVVQMVSVGESVGKVDELLLHVSNYYDSQIEYTISNLTSLIEPILIFFLGCVVLFMALGIFLPMWNLIRLFAK